MTTLVAFLIKEADDDQQAGAIIRADYLTFDKVKRAVEAVVGHRDLRNKFDLPMADSETTLEITDVDGVALAQFVFHDVERRDWAVDAVQAMVDQNPDWSVTSTTAGALAALVRDSLGTSTLSSITGEWRGITHVEV